LADLRSDCQLIRDTLLDEKPVLLISDQPENRKPEDIIQDFRTLVVESFQCVRGITESDYGLTSLVYLYAFDFVATRILPLNIYIYIFLLTLWR